jgi:hypothetical protein
MLNLFISHMFFRFIPILNSLLNYALKFLISLLTFSYPSQLFKYPGTCFCLMQLNDTLVKLYKASKPIGLIFLRLTLISNFS